MTEEEFCQYVLNSLVILYPDACDEPGKRVMIKVDSGPGSLGQRLLTLEQDRGPTYTQYLAGLY